VEIGQKGDETGGWRAKVELDQRACWDVVETTHAAFGEPFHRWTFERFAKGSARAKESNGWKRGEGECAWLRVWWYMMKM